MRIALVGDEFYSAIGGASAYAMGLGAALAKLDADPVVITHALLELLAKRGLGKNLDAL